MTQFLFANNAATTVGSTFSSLSTTLAVATGTGILFPSPALGQQFAITISPASSTTGTPYEICYVTAVSGDTFTVARAQEGTTALNWSVGDFVQNRWTQGQAAALAQQVDVQKQAGNFATDTGTANVGAITLTPAPVSMSALIGAPIRVVKAGGANTAAYTLNVNSLGAVNVYSPTRGGALISGDLPNNFIFSVVFDGSNFILQTELGVNTPGGTAGGDLAGTYPNPVVAANAVTNAKQAQMTTGTLKGNNAGITTNPQDLAISTVVTMLGFNQSFGIPGWNREANGYIRQWGVLTNIKESDGAQSITYPIAFPTACLGASASTRVNSYDINNNNMAQIISNSSASQLTVMTQNMASAGALAIDILWESWGY